MSGRQLEGPAAEKIGLSMREATAPVQPRGPAGQVQRREAARPVQQPGAAGAVRPWDQEGSDRPPGTGLRGTGPAGPVQGFGRLWEKTYTADLGPAVSPLAAIASWQAHFPGFRPVSGGPGTLIAEGTAFAGWIAFSAEHTGTATAVRVHVLRRASDPLAEVALALGGHRREDLFWVQALTALGERLGRGGLSPAARSVCVDRRRQWRQAKNIWRGAAVRGLLQAATRLFSRSRGTGQRRERRAGGR